MGRWEDDATVLARDDVRHLVDVGVGIVKIELEAGRLPALFALGLNRDRSLASTVWARPSDVSMEDGVQVLRRVLTARGNRLWAGLVLLEPGSWDGFPSMSFEGAHREAPPFRVFVPWQRMPGGPIEILGRTVMATGTLCLFD